MKKTGHDRSQKRVTWVDLLILLAVILLIGGGGLILWRGTRAVPAVKVNYILCQKGVSAPDEEWLTAQIQTGGVVFSENGTAHLGRVTGVEVRPTKAPCVKNGEVVYAAVPNKYDLFVTVEAEGSFRAGDGFRVQDIRIAAGESGSFRVSGYFASGAVVVFVEGGEQNG